MSRFCFFILLFISYFTNGQVINPFVKLKYDKVVFYDFEDTLGKTLRIVDRNGKMLVRVIRQVNLESSTIKNINIKLGEIKSYGNFTASCFDPHCGFVYFLNGIPVAQVLICIDCNRLVSDIDIPAQKQGKQGSGEDIYYIADGLSKAMRKFINRLLIEYKFSHQIVDGASFDK